MPLWVAISGSPLKDGEACPRFDPVVWWRPHDLLDDPRFRVIDVVWRVACLTHEEVSGMQRRYRERAKDTDGWKQDSDRLDACLDAGRRQWVVELYEWDSGID
jgi:hypothetical protein